MLRELSYQQIAKLPLRSLRKLAEGRPNAISSIELAMDCERRGEKAAAKHWASIACFQLVSRCVA